jgi:hypothetical protein
LNNFPPSFFGSKTNRKKTGTEKALSTGKMKITS